LDLQEVRLKGAGKYQCVQEVKAIGVAHAEVLQLLGVGGNAQAYLCSLSEYQLSDALPAGSFRPPWRAGRPPAKVVLKVPHKLAGLTAEQHSRYQEVSQIIAWSEHDLLSKPKLRECQFIINSYGFCAARAVGGELLRGLDCQPCLMLEWAELGGLWEKVAPVKGPPAPLDAVACRQAVSQLCRAVRAVHQAGYLHRDIKPDNLLMSRTPGTKYCVTYKLCDFGSAVPQPTDRLHPLRNERDEGTPAYLPPELFWQTTSDTWQVGKCMLALRSGAVPHSGAFEEVRASGLYGSLADPLRESEWVFLEKCLHVNSGSRTDPLALWERGVYPDCL
jgi:serine/threonine protein kinase